MNFKQEVYQQLLHSLNEQIDAFQFTLDELSESVLNETKSTAGDKHETALSMLQLEQSRIAKHLYEAVDAKSIFMQIDIEGNSDFIKMGSLVKTSKGYFFISVALPKVVVQQKTIISISNHSPLGEKLLGKKKHDTVEVNGIIHTVEELW